MSDWVTSVEVRAHTRNGTTIAYDVNVLDGVSGFHSDGLKNAVNHCTEMVIEDCREGHLL